LYSTLQRRKPGGILFLLLSPLIANATEPPAVGGKVVRDCLDQEDAMFSLETGPELVELTEETRKSLNYLLSFAAEVRPEFIVLQVLEQKAERYSLVFPIAFLDQGRFLGTTVPTISMDALPRKRQADLTGVIARAVKSKDPRKTPGLAAGGDPMRLLAATFRDEQIDIVVFELGKRLPLPHRMAVELLRVIRDLPYPVLLTGAGVAHGSEPRKSPRLLHAPARTRSPKRIQPADLAAISRKQFRFGTKAARSMWREPTALLRF
jgi:hypothetical protein